MATAIVLTELKTVPVTEIVGIKLELTMKEATLLKQLIGHHVAGGSDLENIWDALDDDIVPDAGRLNLKQELLNGMRNDVLLVDTA